MAPGGCHDEHVNDSFQFQLTSLTDELSLSATYRQLVSELYVIPDG
jgi:hypothetical protein